MKLKKLLSFTAAAVMTVMALTSSMSVSAAGTELTGSCGDDATWFVNSDDTLVISGTGKINSYSGWSAYAEGIKEIVIEEGITSTASSLFTYCKNVEKIVFPSSLETLGHCLSSSMPALTDVWIFSKTLENKFSGNSGMYPKPGSITKWYVYEGSTTEASFRAGLKYTDADFEYITESDSFPKVTNREPLVLADETETSGPAGLNSSWSWDAATKTLKFSGSGAITIKTGFQKYASAVEAVDMGDSEITSISGSAFGNTDFYGTQPALCPNLKHLTLPSTMKVIGDYAFYKAPIAEENFYLPEGLTSIGMMAFDNSNITGNLKLPSTIKSIGQQAFASTQISSVEIPEGVHFGGTVFSKCNNLKEVTIPVGCTYSQNGEGNAARSNKLFGWCEGLEKVIIEDGAAIAESMFTMCTALKDVYILTKTGSVNISKKIQEESAFGGDPIYHIYKGSTAETALKSADYLTDDNFVYLADTTELEKAIADGEAVDAAKYTDDSMKVLTDAITAAKAVMENIDAVQADIDNAVTVIENAVKGLVKKPTEPAPIKTDPTKPNPTKPGPTKSEPTVNTPSKTTTPKATRSKEAVKKDKTTAKKAMKQAKISKLKIKGKDKKINVSWKKVKKAKGYQVQVSAKKNFKKVIFKKDIKKTKLTIKNKKIKSKKTYFVRIRAYVTYKDTNNKTIKVYSKWNKKLRKVTVK